MMATWSKTMEIIRAVFYNGSFEGLYLLEKGYDYYWRFLSGGAELGLSKTSSDYPKLVVEKNRIRSGQCSGYHVGMRFYYQDGDLEQGLEGD